MTPWYQDIPEQAFANPRLEEIFKLCMLKRGVCVSRTKFRGIVSDERYQELEDVIVNKLGFKRFDRYYRNPIDEVKDEDLDLDDYFDDFTGIDNSILVKQRRDLNKPLILTSLYVSDNGYIAYAHGSDVVASNLAYFTGSEEIQDETLDTLKNFFQKGKPKKQAIKMFTSIQGDFDITEVGNVGLPLVRDNYPDKVLQGYDHVVSTLMSPNNEHGSIVILEGAPGTGKSYLIRGLMEDLKATFIFIPVNSVEDLSNPAVIPILLGQYNLNGKKPIVLIVEDGDQTILSRNNQTNSLISTVLNMGDGILGELLHTKMIISTNIPKANIDDAVLRAGRLNSYIQVVPLDKAKASEIYTRLTKKEYEFDIKEKTISLADVYALASSCQTMFKEEKKDNENGGRYA